MILARVTCDIEQLGVAMAESSYLTRESGARTGLG